MELAAGDMLDRYRLITQLGEGGQGSVWRVIDTLRPERQVALKILRLPGARSVDTDRLRREARALARLEHPSLVRCYGLFEDLERDVLGLVLDLVDGTPLSDVASVARMSRHHRQWLLRHLAGALRALHDAGLVHRDVKPANVLVRRAFLGEPAVPENVKLIDLGIAAPTGNPQPLTNPGSVVGTVPYMAPEVIDPLLWGDEPAAGPQRDVFAFGVLAMELLRGAHPTGLPRTARLAAYAVAYGRYADRTDAWPPGIRDDPHALLFERCLALRASERPAHGRTLVELLQATHVDGTRVESARTAVSRAPPMRVLAPGPTLSAGEDPSPPPPTLRERGGRARWILAASLLPLAGLAAFVVALPSSGDAPSGDAPEIPQPQAAASPPASPPRPSSLSAPVPSVLPTCGDAGAALVTTLGRPFCVDVVPVTVEAYERQAGRGAAPRDASWPGMTATPIAVAAQTRGCRGGKPAEEKLPVNCVDWDQASRYCAATSGRRLPSPEEWAAALQTALVHTGDEFEWTREARVSQDYLTCSARKGCKQGNPRVARNDTIVFRCVSDPR